MKQKQTAVLPHDSTAPANEYDDDDIPPIDLPRAANSDEITRRDRQEKTQETLH